MNAESKDMRLRYLLERQGEIDNQIDRLKEFFELSDEQSEYLELLESELWANVMEVDELMT